MGSVFDMKVSVSSTRRFSFFDRFSHILPRDSFAADHIEHQGRVCREAIMLFPQLD
jgi:hypothetical protein